MYRLILGCNIWNILLLSISAVLGLTGSRWHVTASLFATIFSAMVHGGGAALFMGGSKLIKEHVGRFNMPLAIIDRLNVVYHAYMPRTIAAGASMPTVGVLGGLVGIGMLPGWTHGGLSLAALLYQIWMVPYQYRWLKRFHDVVKEVEANLPPSGEMEATEPHPDYQPDVVVLDARGKARALVFIGLSVPFAFVGYFFISGFRLGWMTIPVAVGTVACLAGALHYHRAASRADS
ncbi:MAG: hypothetical protein E2P04_01435 [Acidobacteria bacterium]|nr:MAG: hypothetical protein E2P04_01435 [Acidobacteriota bacterium]